jgi:hypothetical protein
MRKYREYENFYFDALTDLHFASSPDYEEWFFCYTECLPACLYVRACAFPAPKRFGT